MNLEYSFSEDADPAFRRAQAAVIADVEVGLDPWALEGRNKVLKDRGRNPKIVPDVLERQHDAGAAFDGHASPCAMCG